MSGVTIREMENVASGFGGGAPEDSISLTNDIGNVINLNDIGDDFGLGMLANNQPKANNSSGRSIQMPSGNQPASSSFGGIGLQEINIASLEPIDMNAPLPNIEIHKETGGDVGANLYSNTQTATGPVFNLPSTRDPEKEKQEKMELINKLQRLEAKGFPVSKRFTMDNSLDEVKQEYIRIADARNLEGSLRFQRQMLMGVVTGMEWMNTKFDPFDLKLEGWSEGVHENVEDFDEIFEDLYDKYKDRGKMAPEVRLMMSLAGSGFMCHVGNTFFRSKMQGQGVDLRNNPELARQVAQEAANQAGPGFGKFMGAAMNSGGIGSGSGIGGGFMGAQQQQQMPQPMPMMQGQSTGAFFQNSRVPNVPQAVASVEPPKNTARREMRGPSGVDDILKTFEEVRRAEAMEFANQVPLVPQQPELQSVGGHSDEMRSQADTLRSGGGSGRRRRKATVIEGNTLNINV